MRVFLIHGMGRTHVSLALLGRRLRAAGHQVLSFDYFVTRETLEAIAERFIAFVLAESRSEPFAVVGHSLGNIITRMTLPALAAAGGPDGGLRRFVMLAPPNQPPVMARALEKNLVFRVLTRDAGRKLLDEEFYARLPIPEVPTLVIAGTRGPRAAWLPFRGEPSDGVVRVVETHLRGGEGGPAVDHVEHVEVPAIHTFIMNETEVARLVLRFLDRGALLAPGAPDAPDGTAPDGTAPDGTAPDGRAPDGPAREIERLPASR